jgi:hypothetical protein
MGVLMQEVNITTVHIVPVLIVVAVLLQTGWKETEAQEVPPEASAISEYLDELSITFHSIIEVCEWRAFRLHNFRWCLVVFTTIWSGVLSLGDEFSHLQAADVSLRSLFSCAVLGKKTRAFSGSRRLHGHGNLCYNFENSGLNP